MPRVTKKCNSQSYHAIHLDIDLDGSLQRAFSISDGGETHVGGNSKLARSLQERLFHRAVAPEGAPEELPQIMLVFAHPDDETVALGARLGRFGKAHFVHVTDGAPRNEQDSRWHGFTSWREYRAARAEEFRNLLSAAGIEEAAHECLEIPDQEASQDLAGLTGRVRELIEQHKPDVIFTHPFEGGHPDHDACAFAVHHAARLLNAKGKAVPVIVEGAFYNAGAAVPGELLPCAGEQPHLAYRLSREEKRRKQARMDCFKSQKETLHGFPLDWERFRIAPMYDFRNLPHEPPLLYDRYPWGMTSTRFNQLAIAAEDLLHEEA